MPKYNVKIDRNNIIMVLVLLYEMHLLVFFVTCCSFPKNVINKYRKTTHLELPKIHKGTTMHTKPLRTIKNCKMSYRQISKQVMGISQNNHLYLLDNNKRDRNMTFDISFTRHLYYQA